MNGRLAALELIAGCLSVCDEPDHNDALYLTIESGGLEWETVIAIANKEFVTPALWVALRDRRLTEHLPADVRDYLCELHRLNVRRNARLKAQAVDVVRQLNAIDVEPLLLKGAAGLFVETFPDPGSRVMVDLDILVPESAALDCWDALRAVGYRPKSGGPKQQTAEPEPHPDWPADYRRHQHLRALYRTGEFGTVEIHRSAISWRGGGLLPTEQLWRNVERLAPSGAAMAVPTPTYRVLHNLVHWAIVDSAYLKGRIPLRSLHELAQMGNRYRDCIDWEAIAQRFARNGKSHVLRGCFYLSCKLFGGPRSDAIPQTPRAMIHFARARLQARWSRSEAIIEPVLDFWEYEILGRLSHFSAENIRVRYQCGDDSISITKGRVRLVVRRVRLTAALVMGYSRWMFRHVRNRLG